MQKTILAVSALAALVCLSAFAFLEETTSPAHTQAPADTARFVAENKFITGEQYLTISNVEAHPHDDRLQFAFDVAWDASWHDDLNWDAAWLFIKGQRLDGTWHHLPIMPGSPTMLHTDGPDAAFENPVDGAGFFVHRKEKGEGDNHWQIAVDADASGVWSQFRVFGLEMVYVPEGSFNIGTAKATSDRDEVIVPESGGAPYNPFFTYREYVWGINEHGENRDKVVFTSTILQADGTPAVDENGLERVDGNLHVTMFHYQDAADVCPREPDYRRCRQLQGGDGGIGPVRVGVYGAASSGDRVRAGASYYGVMELGGNLQEPVVTVGHPYGRQFKGTHGDGTLTPDGTATNADWQAIDGEYAFGGRGGSWRFSWNHARTSDRFKGLRTKANRRAAHIGFRGVRTGFSARFE